MFSKIFGGLIHKVILDSKEKMPYVSSTYDEAICFPGLYNKGNYSTSSVRRRGVLFIEWIKSYLLSVVFTVSQVMYGLDKNKIREQPRGERCKERENLCVKERLKTKSRRRRSWKKPPPNEPVA